MFDPAALAAAPTGRCRRWIFITGNGRRRHWVRLMAGRRSRRGIRSPPPPRSPRRSPTIAVVIASTPRPKSTGTRSIQAEDELSSIGIVIGATWNGARAFTATSGPGISLMQEFLGLAYFAEISRRWDLRRAARQPVNRHVPWDPHPAGRHPVLRPRPRTATPSMCCCSPRIRADAFALCRRGVRSGGSSCRPRFLSCSTSTLGMNDWLDVEPVAWRPKPGLRPGGKVMTAEQLDAGVEFGRYLDVDGDSIPIALCPARTRRAVPFSPAARPRTDYARYSEEGPDYVEATCSALLTNSTPPKRSGAAADRAGGARCDPSMGRFQPRKLDLGGDDRGARSCLEERGVHLDTLRVRAYPFHDDVFDCRRQHDRVFVSEQNRDAQLRTLLAIDGEIDPARLDADPALRSARRSPRASSSGDRRYARCRDPSPRCGKPCRKMPRDCFVPLLLPGKVMTSALLRFCCHCESKAKQPQAMPLALNISP